MTCAVFEEQIALDAGGDLPEAHRAALVDHLQTCAACRELAAALTETQGALRDLGKQSVDAMAGAAVRRRVQAALAEKANAAPAPPSRAPRWHWAVAALLILGLSMTSIHQPARDKPMGSKLVVQPAPSWTDSGVDGHGGQDGLALAQVRPPAVEVEASMAPPSLRELRPSGPSTAAHVSEVNALTANVPEANAPETDNEPMVIQLVSDDNSVVIHWLVDATS